MAPGQVPRRRTPGSEPRAGQLPKTAVHRVDISSGFLHRMLSAAAIERRSRELGTAPGRTGGTPPLSAASATWGCDEGATDRVRRRRPVGRRRGRRTDGQHVARGTCGTSCGGLVGRAGHLQGPPFHDRCDRTVRDWALRPIPLDAIVGLPPLISAAVVAMTPRRPRLSPTTPARARRGRERLTTRRACGLSVA